MAESSLSGEVNATTPLPAPIVTVVTTADVVTDGLTARFDSTDLTALSNGDTVTSWSDASGSGNNLGTDADTNGSPTLVSNGRNGLPVVSFNGQQSLETAGDVDASGDIFAVFKRSDSDQSVIRLGGASFRGFVGYAYPGYTTHVEYSFNGSEYLAEAPSEEVGNWALAGARDSQNASKEKLQLGYDTPGYANLVGDVAEVLVYKRNLSPEERRRNERYLSQKWGL